MLSLNLDEEAIFDIARRIDSNEARGDYIQQACGNDTALRARVEALLQVQSKVNNFLEGPPSAVAGTVDLPPIAERPGSTIGPYRLMEQIGEGGMGVVYVAEQHLPLQRKVALKVIRPGMDTREVISRFEAERQALALMDHPNIAKVFDAGSTASGRPFFVMELVRGIPITDYCDRYNFTTRQRLELFVSVCQAVQHAHQKGIIHRDLKPSNVLVTEHDGTPVVKVIDFGVAKAINQRLTERTIYTRFQQMVGTPLYMSPEQADLSGLDVDTRSDIYSLGVLLYELLTGETPFSKQQFGEAAYDEIRRIIRDVEPVKPSTKVHSLGATASSISARRQADPQALSRMLRGELDWVVMKAMEKNRTRRYETATGFANDILRYLNHESVSACPPSLRYRAQKFIRRNRLALGIAGVVFASLVIALIGSTWQTHLVTLALKSESRQREHALEEGRRAREAAEKENAAQVRSEQARIEATAAKEQAEFALHRTRKMLYRSDIEVIQQEYENANLGRVRELLDRHLPGENQPDLRGFEWYFLNRLSRAYTQSIETKAPVFCVAYSPDGKLLATGGGWIERPNELVLWDVETGKPRHVLEGHAHYVKSVSFSPDGGTLASGSSDATVKLWDVETGTLKRTFKGHNRAAGRAHFYPTGVESVVFSNDGKRLASGGADGTIRLWELDSDKVHVIEKAGTISSLSMSPSGDTLASSDFDTGRVTIWSTVTRQEVTSISTGHRRNLTKVRYSPTKPLLVSASFDGAVKLWNTLTGDLVNQWDAHEMVLGMTFSPEGELLITCGADRTIKIWDLATLKLVETLKGHEDRVSAIEFSADGRKLVSAGWDHSVKFWDVSQCISYPRIQLYGEVGSRPAFSPDGKSLAISADGTTMIIDSVSGSVQQTLPGSPSTFISNHELITYTSSGLAIWNLSAGSRKSGSPFVRQSGFTNSLAIDRQRGILASGLGNGFIYVWDISTGKQLKVLRGHKKGVRGLSFSSDGAMLASAGQDRTVRIWNVVSGELLHTLTGHRESVNDVQFSPEGDLLASASLDRSIRLWKVASGQLIESLNAHADQVYSVRFSPDGRTLLSGSIDKTIRFWDVATRELRVTLATEEPVTGLSMSEGGESIAIAGTNSYAAIWHAPRMTIEAIPFAPIPVPSVYKQLARSNHSLERSIELAQLFLKRSITCRDGKDKEGAIRDCNHAIDVHQGLMRDERTKAKMTVEIGYVAAIAFRAELRSGMGDYHLAFADYERVIEIQRQIPGWRSFGQLGWEYADRLSTLLAKLESPEDKRACSQRLAELSLIPVRWFLHNNEPSQAIDYCKKAVDFDPEKLDYLRGRAEVFASLGKVQEARADYNQVLQRNPADWSARMSRALAPNGILSLVRNE